MEEYSLLRIDPVITDNYNGFCALILIHKGFHDSMIKVYLTQEQAEYLSNYNGNESSIVKDCFVVEYNFYKNYYQLTFNKNLLK